MTIHFGSYIYVCWRLEPLSKLTLTQMTLSAIVPVLEHITHDVLVEKKTGSHS